MIRGILLAAVGCALSACDEAPARRSADVVVVGAGIAGIAAALEASAAGADVLVVEWSSVPGGHAVNAGGFALVDTPLQRKKGHVDSPDLAYRELMAWGEDANKDWVRQFADRSRADVHDWLAAMGVKFSILMATPEGSIPRFHFAGGTAVNAVVPMLREALARDNVAWSLNSRVEALSRTADGAIEVRYTSTRSGAAEAVSATAVVLATGGFQGNLDLVRKHWPSRLAEPERILNGAGRYARGDGIALGTAAGASLTRIEDQVTFVNGMPNPRDPERGLLVMNPASIWVDRRGNRFVDERVPSKVAEAAVLGLSPQTYWMLFDSRGRRQLRVRGAEWLNRDTIVSEILDNPAVFAKADTIGELAAKTGLPPETLDASVQGYRDSDPSREFGQPPFYAVQLWPMTRKNLGGIAIDTQARALDANGEPVPGLFAAGELTGVAGINGSHGGSGTFLAPGVLIGRIAGRVAAEYAARETADGVATTLASDVPQPGPPAAGPTEPEVLAELVSAGRDGYWHFERSHRVVLERRYGCAVCHDDDWPAGPATTRAARIRRLDSCTTCH